MKKHKWLIFLIIILISFYDCSDDTIKDFKLYENKINNSIKNNELLKYFSQSNNEYILTFEKSTVVFPSEIIQEISTDEDNWITIITLSNGEVINIPTIGSSIDKYIVNTILNPSSCNPLSAKVIMNLPMLGKIKLIVHTKDGLLSPDVEYEFKSVEKGQTIPILGLYPDTNNNVTIIYTDIEGNERSRSTIKIKTEKLNIKYLPTSLIVRILDINKTEPGMNLVSSPGESEADTSIPYMVDMDGNIRWVLDWSKSPILKNIAAQGGVCRLDNGNYVVGDANNHLIAEVDIFGDIVQKWDLKALGYTFHHEISQADNGRFLVAVSKNDAKLNNGKNFRVNDHIIEFDPSSGKVTKEWDYVNMLDSARYFPTDPSLPGAAFGQSQSNWLHNNAISSIGNDYLSNARFHGPFKYAAAGDLNWIIAPHKKWRSQYTKYLLNPLNQNGDPITDAAVISGDKSSDGFEWSWGSHSPVLMPNGNILLFDNGYGRNYNMNEATNENLYSRIVEYEVDETNMTVRQVWQYGKERGRECYAPAMSSVQYLKKTGNRLFCPGIAVPLSNGAYGGRVIEINAETNEVVFELEVGTLGGTAFHRSYRMPLYPETL